MGLARETSPYFHRRRPLHIKNHLAWVEIDKSFLRTLAENDQSFARRQANTLIAESAILDYRGARAGGGGRTGNQVYAFVLSTARVIEPPTSPAQAAFANDKIRLSAVPDIYCTASPVALIDTSSY